MRVLTLVIILLILGAIGFVSGSIFLEWQPVWGIFQSVRGYGPAKTPEEAFEKFNKAIAARDYVSASEYCTGDFAKVMHDAHKAANSLGKAIDNLEHTCQLENVAPSNATVVYLRSLEPFPRAVKFAITSRPTDDSAIASVSEDISDRQLGVAKWNVDFRLFRALAGGEEGALVQGRRIDGIALKRENGSWKIDFFPKWKEQGHQARAEFLVKYYQDYARPLETLKDDLKRDRMDKNSLETEVKSRLEGAKR